MNEFSVIEEHGFWTEDIMQLWCIWSWLLWDSRMLHRIKWKAGVCNIKRVRSVMKLPTLTVQGFIVLWHCHDYWMVSFSIFSHFVSSTFGTLSQSDYCQQIQHCLHCINPYKLTCLKHFLWKISFQFCLVQRYL